MWLLKFFFVALTCVCICIVFMNAEPIGNWVNSKILGQVVGVYELEGHDHDDVYSLLGHNHNSVYSLLAHLHEGVYASLVHWHNDTYSLLGHNHSGVYSLVGHTHDFPFGNLMVILSPSISQIGWTTAPSSLSSICDEDLGTSCSEAVDTSAPIVETDGDCQIKIDLGAKYVVTSIYIKIGWRGGASFDDVRLSARCGVSGGLTDSYVGAMISKSDIGTTEVSYYVYDTSIVVDVSWGTSDVVPIRYIILRGWVGSAGQTLKLKVYEVVVLGFSEVVFP